MTICFDLRALQIGHQNRGIGMYVKSLLENLNSEGDRYVFYAFDRSDPIKELGIKVDFDYELVSTPTIKTSLNSPRDVLGLIKLVNHSFGKLKATKPDVFVQFDFMLGIPKWRKLKTIVIGYDLIPLIKKNEYLPSVTYAWQHSLGKRAKLRSVARSIYYRFRYRLHYRIFKRADSIITISAATSKSFAEILGIDPVRLYPIPLAPVFSSQEVDDSITKRIEKPYLLYIGGTDSRKRIQDIVHAFNIVRGRGLDIRLALAGNEFSNLKHIPNIEGRNSILDSPYKKDIVLLGFVSDAQKIALYRSAFTFVFCSTYEGFGLPIVEAMSEACPVVSYDNSSIPEAAGNAALLVETGDYVGVANQILSLRDQALRQRLIAKGEARARKFNWSKYAAEFLKTVKEVSARAV